MSSVVTERPVTLTDGVYGTELQRLGLSGECLEVLNIERPELVRAIASSYVYAGSEAIMTNSLGANRVSLARHGLAQKAYDLAQAAARISVQAAAGTGVRVFGSLGATGKIVMLGELPEEEFSAAFEETVSGLTAGGAEAIVLETFTALAEIRLALRAARRVSRLPVIVSMSFGAGHDGCSTVMGNRPADIARTAEDEGAAAVGANCGTGPDAMLPVIELFAKSTRLPVWAKPNAGRPELRDGATVFPMEPESFARHTARLVDAGARFVGGCCGCGPSHIAALRHMIDSRLE